MWQRSWPLIGPPPHPSTALCNHHRQALAICPCLQRDKQSPLQPVMLCVASHKCQHHCGTVINFGALGKMSSRCLFGLSFPTPLPTPAPPRVLDSRVESGMPTLPPPSPPPPPAVTQPQPPPVFEGGGGSSSSWRHKALPDLTMILFSDHSFFLTPLAVCWVHAAGVWWEKAWPSMEELQHFTVSVAD